MLIALPSARWERWSKTEPERIAQRLIDLARRIDLRRVQTHPRGPKSKTAKGYVDGATARTHVSTAMVLKLAKAQRP